MDTAADAGRRFQSAGSESYAIAIDNAEAIVKDIQEQRGSSTVQIGPRGFLGVSVDDNNGSNGPFGGGGGGTSETAGAVVADVLDGTPAAKAGLQAGDVITAIDGKIVDSNSALTDRLHGFNPGDKVKVTWTDTSGQSHTTTITLADGPVA
jgi:S1-C subfamily serine protease